MIIMEHILTHPSKVADYKGFVLSEAGYGESMVANEDIDLPALRYFRNCPAMGNLLAHQRFELYVEGYQKHSFYPPNTLLEKEPTQRHFVETQVEVIKNIISKF